MVVRVVTTTDETFVLPAEVLAVLDTRYSSGGSWTARGLWKPGVAYNPGDVVQAEGEVLLATAATVPAVTGPDLFAGVNSTFDTGVGLWANNAGGPVVWDGTEGHTTPGSLKFTVNASGVGSTTLSSEDVQAPSTPAGFRIGCWVKSSVPMEIGLQVNAYGDGSTTNYHVDGTWQYVTIAATQDTKQVYSNYKLIIWANGVASGDILWVDDIDCFELVDIVLNWDLWTEVYAPDGSFWNSRGLWDISTAYTPGDVVEYQDALYICSGAAPAGPFDSNKWGVIYTPPASGGGITNTATGTGAFAVDGATATGQYSIALGAGASAVGANSIGIGPAAGYPNTAGVDSVAIGNNAAAGGVKGVAIGSYAGAVGDYSIAIGGNNPYATAAGSAAIGCDSAGTASHSTVQDEMMLGTPLTTVHAGLGIKTSTPSANGNPVWRLGAKVAAAVTLDATQYVEVMIAGQLVKLAVVT